jgi:hypothetical protein
MRCKEMLAGLTLPPDSFGVVPYVEGAGEALFEQIETRGMEGVVLNVKTAYTRLAAALTHGKRSSIGFMRMYILQVIENRNLVGWLLFHPVRPENYVQQESLNLVRHPSINRHSEVLPSSL